MNDDLMAQVLSTAENHPTLSEATAALKRGDWRAAEGLAGTALWYANHATTTQGFNAAQNLIAFDVAEAISYIAQAMISWGRQRETYLHLVREALTDDASRFSAP